MSEYQPNIWSFLAYLVLSVALVVCVWLLVNTKLYGAC